MIQINLRAPKKDSISTLDEKLIEREWDIMMDVVNFFHENGLMYGAPLVTEVKYIQDVNCYCMEFYSTASRSDAVKNLFIKVLMRL